LEQEEKKNKGKQWKQPKVWKAALVVNQNLYLKENFFHKHFMVSIICPTACEAVLTMIGVRHLNCRKA
jgi:hypothetical protein